MTVSPETCASDNAEFTASYQIISPGAFGYYVKGNHSADGYELNSYGRVVGAFAPPVWPLAGKPVGQGGGTVYHPRSFQQPRGTNALMRIFSNGQAVRRIGDLHGIAVHDRFLDQTEVTETRSPTNDRRAP